MTIQELDDAAKRIVKEDSELVIGWTAVSRRETMAFLISTMNDKEAPRHERIQAASLLAEMTK